MVENPYLLDSSTCMLQESSDTLLDLGDRSLDLSFDFDEGTGVGAATMFGEMGSAMGSLPLPHMLPLPGPGPPTTEMMIDAPPGLTLSPRKSVPVLPRERRARGDKEVAFISTEKFISALGVDSWLGDCLNLLSDRHRAAIMNPQLSLNKARSINGILLSRIKQVVPLEDRLRVWVSINRLSSKVAAKVGALTPEQAESVLDAGFKIQKAECTSAVAMKRVSDILKSSRPHRRKDKDKEKDKDKDKDEDMDAEGTTADKGKEKEKGKERQREREKSKTERRNSTGPERRRSEPKHSAAAASAQPSGSFESPPPPAPQGDVPLPSQSPPQPQRGRCSQRQSQSQIQGIRHHHNSHLHQHLHPPHNGQHHHNPATIGRQSQSQSESQSHSQKRASKAHLDRSNQAHDQQQQQHQSKKSKEDTTQDEEAAAAAFDSINSINSINSADA
eukprot:CAMPEP_0206569892 /NCGR_PEP_ID=MMETSP0325_2-20121206/26704_1 /ASSEMBLY_ACC=CAM_ASM_000347 /TAXON_ID=2866 /ORGANISM="Crypthecodinium cohnii, Strain Seligo" /LENGTH=444 /DNA_ID=CAMNT_0054073559 /DNA_START=219 /DNA_END=1550 /DNA_ORIENTATION=+